MIGLGLRLTLSGGKEAAVRLAITAAAVALGVGMLLVTLAGINALQAQNARAAWLNTSPAGGRLASRLPPGSRSSVPGAGPSAPDALWWLASTDQFGNQTIDRVDVAATGPRSPVQAPARPAAAGNGRARSLGGASP